VSGSLRAKSLNTGLLRAACELAPEGMEVTPYQRLRDLPLYDEDIDTDDPPEAVGDLRQQITEADAVLIVTPEYNYSIPGGLKNAIDWASKPFPAHSLRHKPVAVMGASPGNFGTLRAQLAFRHVWLWTESIPVIKPEVHVFRAHERFDADGNLTDEDTRALVVALLESLRTTVHRTRQDRDAARAVVAG
jgi:chromate reductase